MKELPLGRKKALDKIIKKEKNPDYKNFKTKSFLLSGITTKLFIKKEAKNSVVFSGVVGWKLTPKEEKELIAKVIRELIDENVITLEIFPDITSRKYFYLLKIKNGKKEVK